MKIDLRGLIAVLILAQGCSKLDIQESSEASTFREAEACINGSSDACIFNKSAVAQSGTSMTAERLGGYQTYGVQLADLDGSGYLKNTSYAVVTAGTPRLTATKGFRQFYNPATSDLEQVMAYYYVHETAAWMTSLGYFPGSGANIQIVADSSFSGWVPGKAELHLERNGDGFPAALDGSLIVDLYTEAMIWRASSTASHSNISAKTVTCSDKNGLPVPSGCCSSSAGCGPAIIRGAADYAVAAFFGEGKTRIGEGWKNDPAGLTLCGLPRDVANLANLSVAAASARCTPRGATNHVNVLGILYGSIWWEARKQATNKSEFDKLFLLHFQQIRGDDDFASIKGKILTLDTNTFGGRYGSILSTEFSRRGL